MRTALLHAPPLKLLQANCFLSVVSGVKVWALGVFIVTVVSLLLGPVTNQR